MTDKIVVLVTCGSVKEARRIARALVDRRLAACVNVFQGPVESVYCAKEFLLVIKTSRRRFRALQAEIQRLHSYDVPEIIALPIEVGSREYLEWLSASVSAAKR
jgi:periplasmic divalent cation tolerance protein